MAGYPYVTQVQDTPTRKALINAFDLTTGVQNKLTALQAEIDALKASAITINQTDVVLPVSSGGTGLGSFNAGDLLAAQTSASIIGVADVPTGNVLLSGGVANLPKWGKVVLTSHVAGILPVGNGGTGTGTAFTAGSVVFAGASGVYTQDNTNFFFDDSADTLKTVHLHLNGTAQVAGDFLSVNVGTLSGTGNPRGQNIFGTVVPNAGAAFRIRVSEADSAVTSALASAASITLDSGFNSTASGASIALRAFTNSITPGLNPFGYNTSLGNAGIVCGAFGSGAPTSTAIIATAGNGFTTAGIGLLGFVDGAGGATAQGIGVWGSSLDSGAVGNIRIGGLFDLQGGSGNAPAETASAALIADNRAVSAPVFIARVNGSAVVTIDATGNLGVGTATFGTSAATVVAVKNGTAPSTSPVDEFQLYSKDIVAGNAAPHFRTEGGDIIKLFKSAAYTPTNVTTDRSYDANATTVDELADVLGTLIADLQTVGLVG